MIKRLKYLFIFFGTVSQMLQSQTDVPHYKYDQAIWMGYYNYLKLNDKWNINSDIQYRTKEWYKEPSQALIRTGLVYKVHEQLNFTVGLAHFRYFLENDQTRGEWRPWQEIGLLDKLGKFKIANRIRIEERYNQKVVKGTPTDAYVFNWRFRYKLDIQFPVYRNNDKVLYVMAGNEIMINAGSNAANLFDQDRIYAGLNFEANKNITLQFQFMHIWQLLPNGYTIDKITVIRFNLLHTIKL